MPIQHLNVGATKSGSSPAVIQICITVDACDHIECNYTTGRDLQKVVDGQMQHGMPDVQGSFGGFGYGMDQNV